MKVEFLDKLEVRFIKLLEAVMNRRSINTFTDKPIETDVLQEVFTYASWAPTHYMKEPWEIKLYQGHGKVKLIDKIIKSYQRLEMLSSDSNPKTIKSITYMKEFLLQIPHHAVIYFKIDKDPIKYEEDYASVSAFIQNAQLVAWSKGIGMLWTITPFMHDPEFARDININPDEFKIAAVMQIGYPSKIPNAKPRISIDEKIELIEE